MYPSKKKSEINQKSPFIQFLKDSSVHGVKYLAQPNRPIAERLLWIAILLSSTGASVYFIYQVIQKYTESPVIVTFQPSQTSVINVPFPAVTVCSVNRFKKSVLEKYFRQFEFESEHQNVSNTTKKVLRELDHVCALSNTFSTLFNYSLDETTVNICEKYGLGCDNTVEGADESMLVTNQITKEEMQLLLEAFPSCSSMIPLCLWEGQKQECETTFYSIITDMGYCCTFNMMPRQLLLKDSESIPMDPVIDSNAERFWRNFHFDDILQEYDVKTESRSKISSNILKFQSKAGQASGLSFLLNSDIDEYYCGNHDSYGFRIYMHSPVEVPHVNAFGMAVSPNSEIFLSIQADLTRADKSIKRLSVDKRKCYYSDEHPLNSYNVYSTQSCVDECLSEAIAEECHCVGVDVPIKFTKPHLKNVTFCEGKTFQCSKRAKNRHLKKGTDNLCKQCLPSCNKIEYSAQLSSLPLRKDFTIQLDEDDGNGERIIRENVTIVHVFFGSDNVYSRIRKRLYGFNDLFAHVGGILGLFLGFSILSLLEPLNILFAKCCANKTRDSTKVNKDQTRNNNPSVNGFVGTDLQYGENWRNKWTGFTTINTNARVYPEDSLRKY